MSGRKSLLALLLCLALLFGGCAAAPPDNLIRGGTEGQSLISASTEDFSPATRAVTLYFRYGTTAYLAPEERQIRVQRNESLEKAIVQALIDGPAASSAALFPLFPPGTEVLAASSQENTLFITFSDAFLGRYADEPSDGASGAWRTEGPLRRRLCLDSLAATLTEAGLCAQVQVLVYQGAGQTTSMRLQAGFLTRTQDTALLAPLTRREECLLTPYQTASLLLSAWIKQDWSALYDLSAGRPTEQTAMNAFAASDVLTAFDLSPGSVSYDGQTAVHTVDMTLRGEGQDIAITGYPLILRRETGLWKMDYELLTAMMRLNQP